MSILISFIFLGIAFIWLIKYRHFLLNPVTTMFGLWSIVIPLSAFNFYNVPPIGDKTYYIIIVGMLGYLIGCIISRPVIINYSKITHSNINTQYKLNYKYLYVLYAISIVILFSLATVAIRLMLNGYSLQYIRRLTTSTDFNELRQSTITVALKNFIATPTVYLAIVVLPIDLIYGNRNKILALMTLLMVFFWVISYGGRSIILWLVAYFAVAISFAGKERFQFSFSKRTKRVIVIICMALFFFLLWSTFSRKGSSVNLFREVFTYYVAPLKHFEKYIEYIDNFETNFRGHGAASFYGAAYPFLYLWRIVTGASSYPSFWVLIRELSFNKMEHTIFIGNDFQMNAFVTVFYQPYLDGRFIGVFLIMIFFGYVCGYTFKVGYRYGNLKYQLFYMLFFQKITDSLVRFYFTQPPQVMCLLFALFAFVPMKSNEISRTEDSPKRATISRTDI